MERSGTQLRRRTTPRGGRDRLGLSAMLMLLALPIASPLAASTGEAPLAVLYISVDTTWTKAGGPYMPADDVVVLPGARLTLEAGAEAVFSEGASLTVQGSISSEGSEAEPVKLGSPGIWGGLALDDSRDPANALQWTEITDASAGVDLHRSWLNASNCTILRGGTGAVLNASWASFTGLNFTGLETGASIENGSTFLLGDSGLQVNGTGIILLGGEAVVERTAFLGGARGIQARAGTSAGAEGCTFANHSINGLEGLGAGLTVENCTFDDEDHCIMTTNSDAYVNGSLMNRTKNDSIRTIGGNITVTWCDLHGGQKALECFDTPAVMANCTITGQTLKAFDGYKSPLTALDNVVEDCYAGFTVDYLHPGLIADNTFHGIYDKAVSILYHFGSRVVRNEFIGVEQSIYTTYADGLVIADNTFQNVSHSAIGMIQGYGNITGNLARNCSTAFATASADVNISSNVVENCPSGLDIQDQPGGSIKAVVTGNEVLNCTYGITTLRGEVSIDKNNIENLHDPPVGYGISSVESSLSSASNMVSGHAEGMWLVDVPNAVLSENNVSFCTLGLNAITSLVHSSGNDYFSNYQPWSIESSTMSSTDDVLRRGSGGSHPSTPSTLTGSNLTAWGLQALDVQGMSSIGGTIDLSDSYFFDVDDDAHLYSLSMYEACQATVKGCEFEGSVDEGGHTAISAWDSSLRTEDCTFERFDAGVICENTSTEVTDCVFTDVKEGVIVRDCPTTEIIDSTFQESMRMGILIHGTPCLVDSCSLTANDTGSLITYGIHVDEDDVSSAQLITVRDSFFSGFSKSGMQFSPGRALLEGNIIEECNVGVTLFGADIVGFEGNAIAGCSWGMRVSSTYAETSVWNSSMSGNDLDIELVEQATVRLVNTPVDDDRVEVAGHENNVLTKSWLVRLRVVDNVGNPLEDALVTVNDVEGYHVFQGYTDAYGLTAPFVADQEVSVGLSTTLLNPHTVTYSRSGVGVDVAQVIFDRNATYDLTLAPLDLELASLVVDPIHPYPGQDVRVNATVRFHGLESVPFFDAYLLLDDVNLADFTTVPGPGPGGTALVRLNASSVSAGRHNVSVLIDLSDQIQETDEENNRLTVSLNVEPLPIPILNVNTTSSGTSPGDPVRFDGYSSLGVVPIVSYRFDFGDGTDGTWTASAVVVHNYSRPGLYSARLALKDIYGRRGDWSASQLVRVFESPSVNLAPVCSFNVTPENGTVLSRYEFRAWARDDDGDLIYRYHWDFDDGGSETSSGGTVTHVFPDDRLYFVTLVVEDDRGALSLQARERVQVGNIPPSAFFTASKRTARTGESVLFSARTGADTDPDDPTAVLDFQWDFGDGTQGMGANTSHVFRGPGPYKVTLTVVDDDGGRSNMTLTIDVTGGTGGGTGGASAGASAGTRGALVGAGVLVLVLALFSLFMALRRARAGAARPGKEAPGLRETRVVRLQRTLKARQREGERTLRVGMDEGGPSRGAPEDRGDTF